MFGIWRQQNVLINFYKTTDERIPWDRIGFYENEKARWNVYTRAVNDKQTLGQKNS